MIRRVVTVALALLLALPAAASAHAVLERTAPVQGAQVERQPELVAFYFNEPVEASFGAVRVFDAEGDQVESGDLVRPEGRSDAAGVRLESDLPDGTYTATYHVVSADSHPVSGGFVFSIGDPGGGSARTIAELLEEGEAGPVTKGVFWLDRLVGYAALGAGIGALLFLLVVWIPASHAVPGPDAARAEASRRFNARMRRLLGWAIAAGFAATVLALPLQGANAAGTSLWSSLDPDVIRDVLETRFGTVMAVRAGAWAALAVLVAIALARPPLARPPSALVAACVAVAAVLAVTPALAGHAASQDPIWLLFPADALHVAAMSVWLGGLLALLVALPAATGTLEPGRRTPLLLAALNHFSALALASVLVLAVTGTVQAVVEVGSVPALVETGFGRLVLTKAALLLLLIGIGAANRERLLPALAERAASARSPAAIGLRLRRNLRAEVGLIAGALAAAALLVSYAPPSDSAAGPVSGRVEIGEQVLEYTVDPARVGRDQIHLYLFDAADGNQFDGAREVRASLTQEDKGIGPIAVELRSAGSGHYVAPAAAFGVPGEWTLRIEVRTSRFDQEEARVEVDIR